MISKRKRKEFYDICEFVIVNKMHILRILFFNFGPVGKTGSLIDLYNVHVNILNKFVF